MFHRHPSEPDPRHVVSTDALRLVEETEAFLEGTLVELYERLGVPIPSWAWTNALAHGSEAHLTEVANRVARRPPDGDWYAARAFVAREVLAAAPRCGGLRQLQATVVAPLELHLAAAHGGVGMEVRDWVACVLPVLAAHGGARGDGDARFGRPPA